MCSSGQVDRGSWRWGALQRDGGGGRIKIML